ncbi:hypothetical protein [Streptomyces sp. BH105]|uniref:hypothetical protein n=1 Tax=Streptomyces sp. BH105 TaxID=3410408 RepID=UPI003CECDEBF
MSRVLFGAAYYPEYHPAELLIQVRVHRVQKFRQFVLPERGSAAEGPHPADR